MQIKPYYTQSNLDICLQSTGSLDNLVKICNENDIEDINKTEEKQYNISENLLTNVSNSGIKYSTKRFALEVISECNIVTGLVNIVNSVFNQEYAWDADSEAIGYEWFITTSPTEPTTVGTFTTSISVNITGLTPSTTYYFWIRKVCSLTKKSAFVFAVKTTGSFVCDLITGVSITSITSDGCSVSWDSGTFNNYEYGVSLSAITEPTVINTTTSTSVVLLGLIDSTNYYFWIRRNCGSGYFSSWDITSFTTSSALPSPPVLSGLVLALFSNYGVTKSGTDVLSWEDLITGSGTILGLTSANKPKAITTKFGGKQAVSFEGTGSVGPMMESSFGFLTGQEATVFIVANLATPPAGLPIIVGYANTFTSVPSAGGFYISENTSNEINQYSPDASGGNGSRIPFTASTDLLVTYGINASLSGSNKTFLRINNSSSGYVAFTNSRGSGNLSGSKIKIGTDVNQVLGCILIYNRILTSTEITDTTNYLTTYFSL